MLTLYNTTSAPKLKKLVLDFTVYDSVKVAVWEALIYKYHNAEITKKELLDVFLDVVESESNAYVLHSNMAMVIREINPYEIIDVINQILKRSDENISLDNPFDIPLSELFDFKFAADRQDEFSEQLKESYEQMQRDDADYHDFLEDAFISQKDIANQSKRLELAKLDRAKIIKKIVSTDSLRSATAEDLMAGLNQDNIYLAKPFIEAIVERQAEMEPLLLARFQEVSDVYKDCGYFPQTPDLAYILMLLTQFKTIGAFELIFEVFNLTDDDNYRYWGDYTTEYLGYILYQTCDGDFKKIENIVFSEQVKVRSIRNAAYDALILAYILGNISRGDIINISSKILDLDVKYDEMIALAMCDMIDINMYELKDKMLKTFDNLSLEDTGIFDRDDFDDINSSGMFDKSNVSIYDRNNLSDLDNAFEFLANSGFYRDDYDNYKRLLEQKKFEAKQSRIAKQKKAKSKQAKISKKKNRKKK